MPAALLASENGKGIERRLEENSSLESPATSTLPSTYFTEVITSIRCACARGLSAAMVGGSGRLTDECRILSSATSVILPVPSTRRITGTASGPLPRETERYTFFDMGLTTTS